MKNKKLVKYYCIIFLTASFLLVGTMTAQAQNLLTNGSFEQGAFGSPANGFTSLGVGSTGITGWSVFNDQIAWGTTPNFTPITAADGIRFLDMQDPGASGAPYAGVSQSIATTIGQMYQFSLQLGTLEQTTFDPDLRGPITVTATAGATSVPFTFAPPANSGMQWGTFSFNFTATSTSTPISILGTSGKNFIGVDNASVIAIPEPSSVALIMLSAAVALFFARR
jgi:hypothetical protein